MSVTQSVQPTLWCGLLWVWGKHLTDLVHTKSVGSAVRAASPTYFCNPSLHRVGTTHAIGESPPRGDEGSSITPSIPSFRDIHISRSGWQCLGCGTVLEDGTRLTTLAAPGTTADRQTLRRHNLHHNTGTNPSILLIHLSINLPISLHIYQLTCLSTS